MGCQQGKLKKPNQSGSYIKNKQSSKQIQKVNENDKFRKNYSLEYQKSNENNQQTRALSLDSRQIELQLSCIKNLQQQYTGEQENESQNQTQKYQLSPQQQFYVTYRNENYINIKKKIQLNNQIKNSNYQNCKSENQTYLNSNQENEIHYNKFRSQTQNSEIQNQFGTQKQDTQPNYIVNINQEKALNLLAQNNNYQPAFVSILQKEKIQQKKEREEFLSNLKQNGIVNLKIRKSNTNNNSSFKQNSGNKISKFVSSPRNSYDNKNQIKGNYEYIQIQMNQLEECEEKIIKQNKILK
ncbi:hypothetical protein PPERSA_06895 [Pseudocohnilembus persalinus]|uniref:Uncharacterized protein n=1 Tax=Pseudocohnilembus persalinus TaxID=266149 RepID=A0A0V0QZ07_PSEPJ|nr:hypothetical protein PPERSA_06895 [Pseudocohnilembus persalinus]|eukprot:KRX07280.1 hypothetical protein PPERSA_06895 [Pseudocohnilembus persalinus]